MVARLSRPFGPVLLLCSLSDPWLSLVLVIVELLGSSVALFQLWSCIGESGATALAAMGARVFSVAASTRGALYLPFTAQRSVHDDCVAVGPSARLPAALCCATRPFGSGTIARQFLGPAAGIDAPYYSTACATVL